MATPICSVKDHGRAVAGAAVGVNALSTAHNFAKYQHCAVGHFTCGKGKVDHHYIAGVCSRSDFFDAGLVGGLAIRAVADNGGYAKVRQGCDIVALNLIRDGYLAADGGYFHLISLLTTIVINKHYWGPLIQQRHHTLQAENGQHA